MAGTKAGAARRIERQREGGDIKHSESVTQGLSTEDPRDPNAGKRPERVPMDQGMNLDIPNLSLDTENYYHRWFAEHPNKPGKVDRAEAAYYEFVTTPQGKKVTRNSGSGGTFYLMKLPKEYRQQDLNAKKRKSERMLMDEAQIKGNEYAPTKKSREGGESSFVEREETDNPYAT